MTPQTAPSGRSATAEALGVALRRTYRDVAAEPLPASFDDLLRRLD